MKTKNVSSYKTPADREFVERWIERVQELNGSRYRKLPVRTSFVETSVLALNHDRPDLASLVVLPGARTFGMYWDLNDNLRPLKKDFRIYLVDVVGQPGLSSGASPDVRTGEFGRWLVEVLDGLGLERTNVAGASFGGLLGMKLAAAAPERVTRLILLNPIGPGYISLAPRSLFYNLLPIVRPNRKNVGRFIDRIILAGGEEVAMNRYEMLAEIILQTLTRFNFKADLPYKMPDEELTGWSVPVWLIVGDKDGLIPHEKTIARAERCFSDLRAVHVLPDTGHGIELSKEAMRVVREILSERLDGAAAR